MFFDLRNISAAFSIEGINSFSEVLFSLFSNVVQSMLVGLDVEVMWEVVVGGDTSLFADCDSFILRVACGVEVSSPRNCGCGSFGGIWSWESIGGCVVVVPSYCDAVGGHRFGVRCTDGIISLEVCLHENERR